MGGVGMYINEKLQYTVRDDLKLKHNACEDLWINLTLDSSPEGKKRNRTIMRLSWE